MTSWTVIFKCRSCEGEFTSNSIPSALLVTMPFIVICPRCKARGNDEGRVEGQTGQHHWIVTMFDEAKKPA